MYMAEQQTVQALVFDILSRQSMAFDVNNDTDMEMLTYCISMLQDIAERNKLLNRETALLTGTFQREGTDMLVVKGQTVAALYPYPALRVPGDIDLFARHIQNDIMKSVSRSLDIDPPQDNAYKECKFCHNDVTIELHRSLRRFGNNRHQKAWDAMTDEVWNGKPYYVEIDGHHVRTLPPTENAVFLFVHIFFHFIREGVSLRQMCDWALLLHHKHEDIDRQRIKALLCDIGLADAYKAFGAILTSRLGLPTEDFPLTITEHDKAWADMILRDILRCGNFGKRIHNSHHRLCYKMETMCVTLRHTRRYWKLAPQEIRTVVPRLIKTNIKQFLH